MFANELGFRMGICRLSGWLRCPPTLSTLQLPVNELLHRPRQLVALRAGAVNNLARDLSGHIAGPALRSVERHDAHNMFVLAFDHASAISTMQVRSYSFAALSHCLALSLASSQSSPR